MYRTSDDEDDSDPIEDNGDDGWGGREEIIDIEEKGEDSIDDHPMKDNDDYGDKDEGKGKENESHEGKEEKGKEDDSHEEKDEEKRKDEVYEENETIGTLLKRCNPFSPFKQQHMQRKINSDLTKSQRSSSRAYSVTQEYGEDSVNVKHNIYSGIVFDQSIICCAVRDGVDDNDMLSFSTKRFGLSPIAVKLRCDDCPKVDLSYLCQEVQISSNETAISKPDDGGKQEKKHKCVWDCEPVMRFTILNKRIWEIYAYAPKEGNESEDGNVAMHERVTVISNLSKKLPLSEERHREKLPISKEC
eukprot:11747616-Ditylum_brightwellii.AAC.1